MGKNILEVKTLEELKEFGKLVEVRKIFREAIKGLNYKGRVNSWANMFESVKEAAALKEEVAFDDPFFKSRAARLIFFLTQADGEMRMKELGVNRKHYTDRDYAKKWMTDLLKVIHPDVCRHPYAADATAEVNRIYEDMLS
jgi:hypothetical protein